MTLLIQCIPCQHGNHAKHYEVVQPVAEGVMGGAKCPCKGECQQSPEARHAEFLRNHEERMQKVDDAIAEVRDV